jgi:serine/alanine racemase
MINPRPTYNSIDLFKFFAALLVVALHTRPFIFSEDFDYYVTCFCRIAVPFFFVTTSFFFFLKENPDIKKYTKRLSILYIAWFIIELPFVYQRFFVDYDHPLPRQILNFTRSLIFNNTWYASWFIMACIISVNIIYYLSKRLNNTQLFLLGVGTYAISLLCSSYYGAFDLLLSDRFAHYHAAFSAYFMPANSFIVALIYVVLGKIIAESVHENKLPFSKKRNIVLLSGIAVLGIIEVYSLRWSVSISDAFMFLPFFASLSLMLLLRTRINISPSASKMLRSMSILIYILHPIFIAINPVLLDKGDGAHMYTITLIESIFMSWLIVTLSSRISVLKKLY